MRDFVRGTSVSDRYVWFFSFFIEREKEGVVIFDLACGEISIFERDESAAGGEGRGLYSSSAEGRQKNLYWGRLLVNTYD